MGHSDPFRMRAIHASVRSLVVLLVAVVASVWPSHVAWSQSANTDQLISSIHMSPTERLQLNNNRVGIVTGAPKGNYSAMGVDLATLLSDSTINSPRVVVQYGVGSISNIYDLRNLTYVDFAIVQADVLDKISRDAVVYSELQDRIRYVTQLYKEQLHLYATRDVHTLADLDGRRLSVGLQGGGSSVTAELLLSRQGIRPQFIYSSTDQAIADLKDGKIDAMLYVVGKPAPLFADASKFTDLRLRGMHFVPISNFPNSFYVASDITAADYPNLLGPDEKVSTLAVPSVMAMFSFEVSSPRYAPEKKFIEAFLGNASKLSGPGFNKNLWCQVDLSSNVQGWRRSEIVADWLRFHPDHAGRICP